MKRRFAIIAVALLAVIALLLVGGRIGQTSPRDLTLSFADFTNCEGRLVARFWLTNGSTPSIWTLHELSRKTGSNWVADADTTIPYCETIPYQGVLAPLIDPPSLVQLVSFTVRETASPVRVVVRCQERSPGLGGVRDALLQIYQQRVKRHSVLVLSGRGYSVTNEWIPAAPPTTSVRARPPRSTS